MATNNTGKWIAVGVLVLILAFLGITCYSRSNNGTTWGTSSSSNGSGTGQGAVTPGSMGTTVTSQKTDVVSQNGNVTSSDTPTVSASK